MAKGHLGFTGTQEGLTNAQFSALTNVLGILRADYQWLHHGQCIGADEQAHAIAVRILDYKIHLHPPVVQKKMSITCAIFDTASDPLSYLERNKQLVDWCNQLIACPETFNEERRSGTWATVRYADKMNKPVLIIRPDGVIARYRQTAVK